MVDCRNYLVSNYFVKRWPLFLFCALAMASSMLQAETLVIGKISENPKQQYDKLKPIVDHVASRMSDLGITGGEVVVARDVEQMQRFLEEGTVDWVTETAFTAITLERSAGARIILRKWKKGVGEYHTVFFTRDDSDIESLADLSGRTIAFEDPGSTSAFFLPASELRLHGAMLTELDSPREAAKQGTVSFVFSGKEINSAVWVQRNLVDAGAVSNSDWSKSENELSDGLRNQLRVFHRTPSVPRALELVRDDLPLAISERLIEILVDAPSDQDAASALQAYERTSRFDRIDADIHKSLDGVRALMDDGQL